MKNFFKSKGFREFLRVLIALAIGLTFGFIITLFVSETPIEAYKSFLLGPLTRLNRIGDWLEDSLTLVLVGLAMCIVFTAGQWYVGAEGQMILGSLISGVVVLFVPLPPRFTNYPGVCSGCDSWIPMGGYPSVFESLLECK